MPSDYSDLINEFGSNSKAVVTPHADLIKEFGGGSVQAMAPAVVEPEKDYRPKPITDEAAKASQQNMPSSPLVQDVKNIPDFIARHGIENYKFSKAMMGKGVENIAGGASATGIGEVGMGALGAVFAYPSAIIEGGQRLIEKTTGNKDFAKRAVAVATSGLPLKTTGQVITNSMPSNRAVNQMIELVGKENIPKVLEELKSNPRLTLMDVNPSVRTAAMGLAAQPGEPLNLLNKFVEGRKSNQKGTVVQAYDEAMGVPVSMKQQVDKLKSDIKDVGKEINPIVANANPVDVTPVIQSIDNILKPGVQSVISVGQPLPGPAIKAELAGFRKLLTDNKSQRTDAKELHQIQSALRAKAEDLLNSTDGQNRQVGYALMNVRNQIVSAIDRASPQIVDAAGNSIGTYKPQLAKYREANDIDDAFKKGQLITRNKLGQLDDHPEYWNEWIKAATPSELEAAKQGARLAVAHQMGAFRFSARKGMEVPESEFNAEKLKALFGEKETNRLMKALNDERKINDTDAKLMQNSMTAMRLLGAKATEVRPDYKPDISAYLPAVAEAGAQWASGGESMGLGAAAVIGYGQARKLLTKTGQKIDRRTNVEIANLASATGEAREALMQALSGALPQGKLTMKQRLQLALPVASNP